MQHSTTVVVNSSSEDLSHAYSALIGQFGSVTGQIAELPKVFQEKIVVSEELSKKIRIIQKRFRELEELTQEEKNNLSREIALAEAELVSIQDSITRLVVDEESVNNVAAYLEKSDAISNKQKQNIAAKLKELNQFFDKKRKTEGDLKIFIERIKSSIPGESKDESISPRGDENAKSPTSLSSESPESLLRKAAGKKDCEKISTAVNDWLEDAKDQLESIEEEFRLAQGYYGTTNWTTVSGQISAARVRYANLQQFKNDLEVLKDRWEVKKKIDDRYLELSEFIVKYKGGSSVDPLDVEKWSEILWPSEVSQAQPKRSKSRRVKTTDHVRPTISQSVENAEVAEVAIKESPVKPKPAARRQLKLQAIQVGKTLQEQLKDLETLANKKEPEVKSSSVTDKEEPEVKSSSVTDKEEPEVNSLSVTDKEESSVLERRSSSSTSVSGVSESDLEEEVETSKTSKTSKISQSKNQASELSALEQKQPVRTLLKELDLLRRELSGTKDKLNSTIEALRVQQAAVTGKFTELKQLQDYLPKTEFESICEEESLFTLAISARIEELSSNYKTKIANLSERARGLFAEMLSEEKTVAELKNVIIYGIKNTLDNYISKEKNKLAKINSVLEKARPGFKCYEKYKIALISAQEDDIEKIKEDKHIEGRLQQARDKNIPVLIKTKNNNFILYGKQGENWIFTPISMSCSDIKIMPSTNDSERLALEREKQASQKDNRPILIYGQELSIYINDQGTWRSRKLKSLELPAALKKSSVLTINDPFYVENILPCLKEHHIINDPLTHFLNTLPFIGEVTEFDLESNAVEYSLLMSALEKGHTFTPDQSTLCLPNEKALHEMTLGDLIGLTNNILYRMGNPEKLLKKPSETSSQTLFHFWKALFKSHRDYLGIGTETVFGFSAFNVLKIQPEGEKFLTKKKDVPHDQLVDSFNQLKTEVEEVSEEIEVVSTNKFHSSTLDEQCSSALQHADLHRTTLPSIDSIASKLVDLQNGIDALQRLLNLPDDNKGDKNIAVLDVKVDQLKSSIIILEDHIKFLKNFAGNMQGTPLSNTPAYHNLFKEVVAHKYSDKIREARLLLKDAENEKLALQEREKAEEREQAAAIEARQAKEREADQIAKMHAEARVRELEVQAQAARELALELERQRLAAEEIEAKKAAEAQEAKNVEEAKREAPVARPVVEQSPEEKNQEKNQLADKLLMILNEIICNDSIKSFWNHQVSFGGKLKACIDGARLDVGGIKYSVPRGVYLAGTALNAFNKLAPSEQTLEKKLETIRLACASMKNRRRNLQANDKERATDLLYFAAAQFFDKISCNFYLMSPPEQGNKYKPSTYGDIYLYKKEQRVFYYLNGKEYNLGIAPPVESFDQPEKEPVKYRTDTVFYQEASDRVSEREHFRYALNINHEKINALLDVLEVNNKQFKDLKSSTKLDGLIKHRDNPNPVPSVV